MRAVRIEGPRQVATLDVREPEATAGEVSVRVRAAAICATDRRLAMHGTPTPRIPGHEVVGVLQDGTEVGVQPNVGCGRCASCALGLENRCPDHVDIGIQRDGGLAEWIVVPERHAVPLEGFPFDLAPSIEPLACCLHAVAMLDVAANEVAVGLFLQEAIPFTAIPRLIAEALDRHPVRQVRSVEEVLAADAEVRAALATRYGCAPAARS